MHLADRIRGVLNGDPTAPAFEQDGGWFKWGEVGRIAARLDDLLRAQGIGENRAVGLIGRNLPAPSSALLGLLATRRCVVPLNPYQSHEGLVLNASAANLAAIVAEPPDFEGGTLRAAAAEHGFATIVLEGNDPSSIKLVDSLRAAELADIPNCALLLSTSGTTGTPKRIPIRYDTLGASMVDSRQSSLDSGDVDLPGPQQPPLIQHSPMVHIAGALSVTRAGWEGRPLVMLKKFNAPDWIDAVRRHRPTAASLPPTMMRAVVNENPPPEALASLIGVWSGASPVDMAVLHEFERRYDVIVMGSYGATEFAGQVAWGSLADREKYGNSKDRSVGRFHPPGVFARVVDPESGQILPLGEIGILEVQVAKIGPEWMRTSDRMSIDADNFLYFEGRADDAINRGGFKIVPTIIADALRRHPSVGDVAVIGVPDKRLGEVPVAAVELKAGAQTTERQALLDFAKSNLIAYQVPTEIKIVASLPRTPSFKIDRNAVKALFD